MNDRDSIERYLLNTANRDDVDSLNERLCGDSDFRDKFVRQLVFDSALRDIAHEDPLATPVDLKARATAVTGRAATLIAVASLAACLLLAIGWSVWPKRSNHVATLIRSEDAAWVSDLPTSVGAKLPPGELRLMAGIATIEFNSGAIMVLEAPAVLRLESDVKSHLLDGSAVIEVPESAIGFVLTTPSGEAVDLGTRFAVNVDRSTRTSDFEVIEGKISVSVPGEAEPVLLRSDEAVRTDDAGISKLSTAEPTEESSAAMREVPIERIATGGRAATFIRRDIFPQRLDPSRLLVKSSWSNDQYDRKAVIGFDMSSVDLQSAQTARLRLNQIESSIGFANRLPQINVFSVYGVVDPDKEGWTTQSTWSGSPAPEDGVLVGQFEIPRSRGRGECVLESAELLLFLREHQHGGVSLVIVREATKNPGDGRALVHAFASSSHASVLGPTLEFEMVEAVR